MTDKESLQCVLTLWMGAYGGQLARRSGSGRSRRQGSTARSGALTTGATPYDLRHSSASLMFLEQRNPIEIANMMGQARRCSSRPART